VTTTWTSVRCPECNGELRFPAAQGCAGHALYQRVYEAARTEMSDAIEALLVKHLGMIPFGGWEARILTLRLQLVKGTPDDKDCDDIHAPLFPPKYYPETGRFGCVLTRAMIGADCDDKDCDGPDAGEGLSPTVAAEFPAVAALLPSAATDCDDRDEADRWCQGCGDERDEDGGCPTVGCDHGEGWDEDCDGPEDCDDEVVRRDALSDTRSEP